MSEDEKNILRRWMCGRLVINPLTFESVIRCNGENITVDTFSPDPKLWYAMKEDLWELCK